MHQILQASDRRSDSQPVHGVRATQGLIAADGFAQFVFLGNHVTNVIGNLIGLADALPEGMPRPRLVSGGTSAGGRRRREQRTGLGALIVGKIDLWFAFPGLAGNDAVGRANRPAMMPTNVTSLVGALPAAWASAWNEARSTHPREHRDALAEGLVNRGPATTSRCVVETGQIIVNQRCTVQQLDRCRGGAGQFDTIFRTGLATARHRRGLMRAPPGNTA